MGTKRQLYIIGIGMGDPRSLTIEAREAIDSAKLLIGARRMLAPFIKNNNCIDTYRTEEVMRILKREYGMEDGASPVAVLMSGDSGFYSGTRKLLEAIELAGWGHEGTEAYEVKVLAGVSSLSYFCARIGKPWEGVAIVDLHGARENLWQAALTHETVFAVTGGDLKEQLRQLVVRGLGDFAYGYVGENLSYEDERIRQGTVAQLADYEYGALAVLYLENPDAVGGNLTGLPDQIFVRGKVPMTKAEVRAVVMSKLRIRAQDIVYDIGAGTGSVSVEMALAAKRGRVYSVEVNTEALELCKLNRERFCLHNMEIVEGMAPEILQGLPAPDVAFIGGSKGNMGAVIAALTEKNPAVRLVVNTVTVENTARALEALEGGAFTDVDMVQVQVNRCTKAGDSHMFTAQNPVTVLSARGNVAQTRNPWYGFARQSSAGMRKT